MYDANFGQRDRWTANEHHFEQVTVNTGVNGLTLASLQWLQTAVFLYPLCTHASIDKTSSGPVSWYELCVDIFECGHVVYNLASAYYQRAVKRNFIYM